MACWILLTVFSMYIERILCFYLSVYRCAISHLMLDEGQAILASKRWSPLDHGDDTCSVMLYWVCQDVTIFFTHISQGYQRIISLMNTFHFVSLDWSKSKCWLYKVPSLSFGSISLKEFQMHWLLFCFNQLTEFTHEAIWSWAFHCWENVFNPWLHLL